jgi:hypothetical protein
MAKPRKPARRVLTIPFADGSGGFVDLELNDRELQAIGHVVTQWSFLEMLIKLHCAELLRRFPESDERDVNSEAFRRRMRAWRRLVTMGYATSPEILATALAIIDDAARLSRHRHDFAHGDIEWDKQRQHVLRVATKDGSRHWNAAQIEEAARQISMISFRLMRIHGEPQTVRGASPRTRDRPD